MERSILVTLMSTHGLARKLERISKALRELPDQNLASLLHLLRGLPEKQKRSRKPKSAHILPLPPRDPRLMERDELQAYLQNAKYFPRKADLLEFARRYEVPANARTPREEIIRLCLRMIHDIPRGFTLLRFLAEQHEPLASVPVRSWLQ
jgi:hypothetical protein